MELRTGVNRKFDQTIRPVNQPASGEQALLRRELGEVLREYRQRQRRTLREVSWDARGAPGHLSHAARGQKDASSELLYSLCKPLNVPFHHVLRLVAARADFAEGRVPARMRVPDSPESLMRSEMQRARV